MSSVKPEYHIIAYNFVSLLQQLELLTHEDVSSTLINGVSNIAEKYYYVSHQTLVGRVRRYLTYKLFGRCYHQYGWCDEQMYTSAVYASKGNRKMLRIFLNCSGPSLRIKNNEDPIPRTRTCVLCGSCRSYRYR